MGRVSDNRGLPFILWLLHIFLLLCLGSANAMYNGRLGVVKPDDPYLFVGEDLILFCNLTSLDQQVEDSSYLYFTQNGNRIPDDNITILTTRSIRLRSTIGRPDRDEGHFVCWLRQEHSNSRKTIGSQHVKADYSPVSVNDVNCTVYNWENMTCKWELGHNYRHPEYISVTLVWTISSVQRDCSKRHMTNTSCTWVSGVEEDSFKFGSMYIMSVVVTNTKRRIKAQSTKPFMVTTSSIVKPAPVVNLHRNDSNATCLWVVWGHTDMVHDKVAYVEYISEWHPSESHKLENIHFKRGPIKVEICGLTPHTEYMIRVAVRPLPRNSEDGYRSEWEYIKGVRTDPSFPEVAPEMCAGCFTERPCDLYTGCRNILVYWQHIPQALRRSIIHKYLVQYSMTGTEKDVRVDNSTTLYPNNSLILSLQQDSNYTLNLFAVTSKNILSGKHSSLIIPSESSKPKGPTSLVVETAYANGTTWTGQFDLRWTPTKDTSSYIVFWCRGNTDTYVCNHEEHNQVMWQEVAGDNSSVTISITNKEQRDKPDNYMVGVARQVLFNDPQLVSSGIDWPECYYFKNRRPRVPTRVDFVAQEDRAGILRVIWQYNMCEKSGHDVYITRFIIFYCVMPDSSSGCQGGEYNITAKRTARSAILKGLEQGAYYHVKLRADSEWGNSDYSEAIVARVPNPWQHKGDPNYSMIGVVLAVLVVLILILIGFCKLRSHYNKTQGKFTNPFEDPQVLSTPVKPPPKTFYQRRPLPQPPPTSACATTPTPSGVASITGTDKRQRGGKHKSITSETSLLGHEDAGHDDDSKRRHKSATGSISERSKLLADDSVTPESVPPVNTCSNSDSGAESLYSSEDHDYASVEGGSGSAEEGGTVVKTRIPTEGTGLSRNPPRKGKGAGQPVVRTGYVSKEGTFAYKHMQPVPEHKPAPSHAPPPPPQANPAYIQAALVSGNSSPPPSMTSFKYPAPSQPSLKTNAGDNSQCGQQPAQLKVSLEPVSCVRAMPSPTMPYKTAPTAGGYVGSEDSTLPRRPPGTKLRQYAPSVQDVPPTACVDPYASTSIAAFSTHIPPPPAPPPHVAQYVRSAGMGETPDNAHAPALLAAPRGYFQHGTVMTASPPPVSAYSGGSTSSYSDDSRVSADSSRRCESGSNSTEPIYSPPWESNSLVPFAIDNRPLSEYMLKLPDNFFDSTLKVNNAPTTEL